MFCRFCGKAILNDSDYCPFCGKDQKRSNKPTPTSVRISFDKSEYLEAIANEKASNSLQKATKILCYAGLVVFLILLFKIAPGFGWTKTISYILGALIAVVLVILFNKKSKHCTSAVFYRTILVVVIAILIAVIGLRITYEAKLDSALVDIPSTGNVHLRLTTDEEFYSYISKGYVRNPSTNIRIGDSWYDSGDIINVELNESYSLKVGCGYSGAGGYIDDSIVFSPEDLKDQYVLHKKVNIDTSEYAEVTITFTRECGFWEIILY